ncbi:6-phosphogluconolactonase [uncultured Bifidobacterium sp.]|uniref:6-phosphogluconolactonase n=1 Tax=uncultured Bifidobacterium sp. TaxID=165187 RepID=UPI0028DD1432|nr:6-phosphogluconolactonase [uncultured Bifidobacterium sp.]
MSERRLLIYPDTQVLARAAAHRLLLVLLDAQCARPSRPRFDLALTGGSDALRMLERLSEDPLTDAVDWTRVHLWWGDERFVANDDPDRNALQARRLLLNRLVATGRLPKDRIHEMPADDRPASVVAAADDEENEAVLDGAARIHERELRAQLGPRPRMDLLILGMGPDGHFASLFPGHPQIGITDRLVVGVDHSPKPPALRLSMTSPLLAASERTWMLTAGTAKTRAFAAAFTRHDDIAYPASFMDGRAEAVWMTTPETIALL